MLFSVPLLVGGVRRVFCEGAGAAAERWMEQMRKWVSSNIAWIVPV